MQIREAGNGLFLLRYHWHRRGLKTGTNLFGHFESAKLLLSPTLVLWEAYFEAIGHFPWPHRSHNLELGLASPKDSCLPFDTSGSANSICRIGTKTRAEGMYRQRWPHTCLSRRCRGAITPMSTLEVSFTTSSQSGLAREPGR